MIGRRSERRQRTKLLVVRLLPAEYAALERAATQRGVSIAQVVRERIFGGAT